MKLHNQTWESVFEEYSFSNRQQELMTNFNMRYECYDARDDFSAGFRGPGNDSVEGNINLDDDDDDDDIGAEDGMDSLGDQGEANDEHSEYVGPAMTTLIKAKGAVFDALRRAGWSSWNGKSHSLVLPRITLDASFGSNAWRNIIKVEKMKAWRRMLADFGQSPAQVPLESSQSVPNDVYIVPSSFISKDFSPSECKWGEVMNATVADWHLNKDQEKAFRIVANHACCVAPEQLLMHLSGMGGTGKSTVVKALTDFFTRQKEPYRFVLLGPTGTSAALIGGATYHSFLGINSNSSSTEASTLSKIEDVRERLTGVGYILIDEHSMLNCRTLCTISARCCEALGVFEQPFGGLNVILCGDFAQLPPVKGYPLYSRSVSLRQSACQTVGEQENTIGKMIWMQFTTVVTLRLNMRQTGLSTNDVHFREALQQLRFRACTAEDRALIRSRIAGSHPELSLDSPQYKDVSVITARNRDKDEINRNNAARFAAENGQKLETFYSVDKLSSSEPSRNAKTKKVYAVVKSMSKTLQGLLWQQPPSTSEQVPGTLEICRGMPALIRHNEATELCMTRGQEARIVAWSSTRVPDHPGRRCLDVLYLQLIDPPRKVKLPSLPPNVIPLTRISQSIEARLRNDDFVRIARSQVPVLPNFAMTDYSSQGKTRQWNVIDLKECRNFQAAYTCLSRGVSIDQTLILRDFSDEKLTGSLDGELRQEYRELDQLSIVTDLIYEGVAPTSLLSGTRWGTLDAYRRWKATLGRHVEQAPIFDVKDDILLPVRTGQFSVETLDSKAKRKAQDSVEEPVTKKPRRSAVAVSVNRAWITPWGPTWDSEDYSCAFDAWIFVLHWLWTTDKVRWTSLFTEYGPGLRVLIENMVKMPLDEPDQELNEVRDACRHALRLANPEIYVHGTRGVDIVSLTRDLFGDDLLSKNSIMTCSNCHYINEFEDVPYNALSPRTDAGSSQFTSIQAFIDGRKRGHFLCKVCSHPGVADDTFTEVLCFQTVTAAPPAFDSRLQIASWGTYRLAGIVYYGAFHFVSRVITVDNKVYFHDGIDGSSAVYEGVLDVDIKTADLSTCGGRKPSMGLYVLADRRRSSAPTC